MLFKDQTRWELERSLGLSLHGLLALMKKLLEDMSDKGLGGTILYFLIFYSEVSFINISIISCKCYNFQDKRGNNILFTRIFAYLDM